MGEPEDTRWLPLTRMSLLVCVFGPALLYTDLWGGGHSVFKFAALSIGAGMALIALARARDAGLPSRLTALDCAVAAYVLWTLITTLLAPEPLVSLTGTRPYWDGLAATLAAGAAYYATRALVNRDPSLGRQLVLAGAATALVLAAALIPAYAGVPAFASLLRAGRAGSLMGQPTFLAGFAVAWLPLLILASKSAWLSKRSGVRAHILRWGAPAIALLLITTFSRSGWLGATVALALWAIFSSPSTRVRAMRGGAALVLGAILIVGLVALRRGGDTIGTRSGAWSYAAKAALEQPIIGSGPGTYVYVFLEKLTPAHYRLEPATVLLDPHSWYLNAASTTGVLGGLFALGIAAIALMLVFRLRARSGPALAAACGAVGYFVHCVFTPNSIATFASALVLLAVASTPTSPRAMVPDVPAATRNAARLVLALVAALLVISGIRTTTAEVAHATAVRTGSLASSRLASTLAPEIPVYAVQHAHLLKAEGRYDEAVEVLRAARSRLPRDAQFANDAGEIVEEIASTEQAARHGSLALSWLGDGVRGAPAMPQYRYAYIRALMRRGDRKAASNQLATLEQQYGAGDPYVTESRNLLRAD